MDELTKKLKEKDQELMALEKALEDNSEQDARSNKITQLLQALQSEIEKQQQEASEKQARIHRKLARHSQRVEGREGPVSRREDDDLRQELERNQYYLSEAQNLLVTYQQQNEELTGKVKQKQKEIEELSDRYSFF